MKPNELCCANEHDVEPLWIVICGELSCTGNILADETEATPYVAALETANIVLLEALQRLVLAFDVGDMKHTAINGRGYAALDESRKAIENARGE